MTLRRRRQSGVRLLQDDDCSLITSDPNPFSPEPIDRSHLPRGTWSYRPASERTELDSPNSLTRQHLYHF